MEEQTYVPETWWPRKATCGRGVNQIMRGVQSFENKLEGWEQSWGFESHSINER